MVDCDEVDQLAVVFNIHIHGLNVGLIVKNIFLNGRLRFEETLECGLSESHLVKLLLLVANLLFGLELLLNDTVTAIHCVHHSTNVKKFSLDPDPSFPERVFPRLDSFINAGGQLACSRVCHNPEGTITVAIVVDGSLFELDKRCVDALIVVVGVILGSGVLFELLLLFLFNRAGIIYFGLNKDTGDQTRHFRLIGIV